MQRNQEDPVFVIETCQNCSKGCGWHTRHDEAKYIEYFKRVSEAIVERLPHASTMRNCIPKSYLPYDLYCNLIPNNDPNSQTFMQVPRTGSFEVSYKGLLIFSKLQGGYWPNVELVAGRCQQIVGADANGEDLTPFLATGASATKAKRAASPSKRSTAKKQPAQDVTPAKQNQPQAELEQPVKPFKLDESQKFLEPVKEPENVAPIKPVNQEVKPDPVEEAPKEFALKTDNGKLVVDIQSAPGCVKKILEIKAQQPDNCMAQAFDEAYYNTLNDDQKVRLLTCCLSGVANPDSCMGCYAMNPKDYDEFSPFFKKALQQYHKIDLSVKKHTNNWSLEGVAGLPDDGVLDLTKLGLPALSMRVRTGRNLNKYPLPGAMTQDDRINMEKDMKKVFDTLIADPTYGGRYVSITPGHECFIDADEYAKYVKAHIMFKDMSVDSYLVSAGIAQHWPHGRGCYVSEDKQFIVWVGEEDHLRIMCMKKGAILNEVFDRLEKAVKVVEANIDGGCAMSKDCGVVTSCPTNIGTGMRASVHIALPNLTADGTDAKAKAVARPLGLSVRGLGGEHTPIGADGTVDISPSARFCISEAEIVTALYLGIKLLKEQEDALAPAKEQPAAEQ